MGDACAAIDDHLSAAGYAQYSRPPFIRRRGHGLGGGTYAPGDVAVDNDTILEPDMFFAVHPAESKPNVFTFVCDNVFITKDGNSGYLHKTERKIHQI